MTDFLPTYLGIIIIVGIVAIPVGITFFVRFYQKKDALEDVKSLVCMLVSVPRETQVKQSETKEPLKDFKMLIEPMEQFFASLTTTIHQRTFFDWLFSTPAHMSFEIISVGGTIQFAIICPKRVSTIIERQIHSYYSGAEINYDRPPTIFGRENPVISGVNFEQAKSFILPIKTYRYLQADPLSSLTNALTKLPEGQNAVIQLLIRPTSDSWRNHVQIATGHVAQNKTHLVNRSRSGRIAGMVGEVIMPSKPSNQPMTANQQELANALQEKGSKVGFEGIMRVVVAGKDEATVSTSLSAVVAAFSQYQSPERNSLKYRGVKGDKIARDYLLRVFGNAPKMILNAEELTSFYHFPIRSLETPGVKWVLSRTLPAPENLPKEGVVLGESIHRGVKQLIRLKDKDRLRHVFMIGKTGTGKTTLFETMIEQDMHAGKGLCFIDPLGDAIEGLLKKIPTERAKDVIIFDPSDTKYPFGLNLLEYNHPEEKDFLIQEVIEIFYKLFDPGRTGIVGPQWEHWARNAALTVMNNPGGGTLIDLPRLFTDDAFRDASIANLTDPVVKAFWQQQLAKTSDFHKSEMYNYFISKFGRFMTNDLMRNIIGQAKSSFNIREIMDDGKILLVNLAKGKIGDINSSLLGLILVSKIQVAAFSRAELPEEKRKPFYLYVDEFQNFTTDTFATILAEARKYGLGLNITNQYFAQLPDNIKDAVVGNVGTLIAYRIGAEDSEYLTHEMAGVTVEDLTNLDRFQAYVKLLVDLTPTKVFSLRGIKLDNKGSDEMAEWIRMANRKLHSMPPVNVLGKIDADSN